MAASRKYGPIVRQIYFYQMADIYDLWHNASTMPKFSPALLAADLMALPGDKQYLEVNDDYDLCLLADGNDSFQFGKARKTEMASVVANGRVKPLTLAHGEKLFDRIHIVFFPSGVVGAEFNLFGPKMPALTEYLISKLSSCTPVAFDRLVHGDVMERLSHVREVKVIEMRIDAARSEVMAPFGDGWIDTAKWMNQQLGVGSVEVALRAGTTARRPFSERAIAAVREMLSGPHLREATDKFKIKAVPDGSNMTISIDLLDDKLMEAVEIPRDICRNPDRYKEFMYNKIRTIYNALKRDIMQAARVIS